MENIIKLHSRAGNNNYLKLMPKPDDTESKTYVLKVTYPYVRVGYLDSNRGNIKFVDPSGGPMIVEGEVLEEAKTRVKSIDFVTGYGYTITFE